MATNSVPPQVPRTLTARRLAEGMVERANRLKDAGQFGQAECLYRESLAIRKRVLGPAHAEVAQSMNNLANLLSDPGQHNRGWPSDSTRENHTNRRHASPERSRSHARAGQSLARRGKARLALEP